MDRLSLFLSMMSGAAITGALAVTVMSLGYYNWWAIGGAAVVGFAMAWPSAYFISRRIKAQDGNWEPPHDPKRHAPIPPRNAREV